MEKNTTNPTGRSGNNLKKSNEDKVDRDVDRDIAERWIAFFGDEYKELLCRTLLTEISEERGAVVEPGESTVYVISKGTELGKARRIGSRGSSPKENSQNPTGNPMSKVNPQNPANRRRGRRPASATTRRTSDKSDTTRDLDK